MFEVTKKEIGKSGPRGLLIATLSTCLISFLLNMKTLSCTARRKI